MLESPEHNPDSSLPATETAKGGALPPNVPKTIGRYHIRRILASGAMGSVFEAAQENPRRVVAIKLMKQGITSRSALRRFEYESQVLARLRHPGIAQVYEAGTHDDGAGPVPYFAMEYIPNAKLITEFATERKLATRRRLVSAHQDHRLVSRGGGNCAVRRYGFRGWFECAGGRRGGTACGRRGRDVR